MEIIHFTVKPERTCLITNRIRRVDVVRDLIARVAGGSKVVLVRIKGSKPIECDIILLFIFCLQDIYIYSWKFFFRYKIVTSTIAISLEKKFFLT